MDWQRLARFFPDDRLEWRILERAEQGCQARVRPQVHIEAVRQHLDTVLGRAGWSYSFFAVGNSALGCVLAISGVSKSAVLPLAYADLPTNAAERANDCLVHAAEHFGILPEADVSLSYWVEADPEAGGILHEPTEIVRYPQLLRQAPEGTQQRTLDSRPLSDSDEPAKPSGQQMIDKLLERLREAGLGLEAAKLVILHKGYGTNAEEAKKLYGKLRSLLKRAN